MTSCKWLKLKFVEDTISVLFSGVDYSRESDKQNGHDPSAYAFSEFVGALQVGEGLSNIARCTKEKH